MVIPMNEKDLLELKEYFLKIEARRWNQKKQGKDREYTQNSYYLGGIFTAVSSLGLEKEFGIRRAGPFYKKMED